MPGRRICFGRVSFTTLAPALSGSATCTGAGRAVASIAEPDAGRVGRPGPGSARRRRWSLTTLSLATGRRTSSAARPAAATTSIEEPTAATRSCVGPTTVPGVTVHRPSARPCRARSLRPRALPRRRRHQPDDRGDCAQRLGGLADVARGVVLEEAEDPGSPAANAPSLTSYWVGSNVAYGSPFTRGGHCRAGRCRRCRGASAGSARPLRRRRRRPSAGSAAGRRQRRRSRRGGV